MRRLPALPLAASLLLLSPSLFASVRAHRHSSSHPIVRRTAGTHITHAGHALEHASYSGMGSERAIEIQTALIQRGYLTGEATGSWDSSSIAAMQKMQSDNGWQTKMVPDSRALIKLGLGAGSAPTPNATTAATASAVSTTAAAPQAAGLPQNF